MMKKPNMVALALVALATCPAAGRAGEGVVALQTADPSCPDDSGNIYVDCLNGTVTDNRTGLVWLRNAGCLGGVTWHAAMEIVAGLADIPDGSQAVADDCGLSDGSSPGEWRLASASEWQAMEADGIGLSCIPGITDDEGTGCWSTSCNNAGLCAFAGVRSERHWTPTSVEGGDSAYLGMDNFSGGVDFVPKSRIHIVWPVRGGQ